MTEPGRRRTGVGRSVATFRSVGLVSLMCLVATACGGDPGVTLSPSQDGQPAVIDAPDVLDAVTGPDVVVPQSVEVALTPVLEIDQPIAIATHPTTNGTFVATKTGTVVEVDLENGAIGETLVDIGSGLADDFIEQGLLGIAFSPDGSFMYLNFTDKDYATVIAEYGSAGGVIDPEPGRTVLRVKQPDANHNGGQLAFGPDGLLYIGFGDGGGANDQYGHGQNPDSLLGSIVRIDPRVTGESPYAVPDDNPFASRGGRPEIFIWGVRNPWRFSFDRLTDDLWIADVGQDALEEINVLYAGDGGGRGANLGWPNVEGSAPFAAGGPPAEAYAAPIYDYGRTDGCSVRGGYVYRGSAIPALTGHYIFGDYCTSQLWGLASSESQGLLERFDLGVGLPENSLVSLFENRDGELYILGFDDTVYRLDPAS
jgi:glucose/arabinose dehydrogenase